MIVVILNGPPRSGKDVIAKEHMFEKRSVKRQLINLVFSMFNINRKAWDARYTTQKDGVWLKEVPWEVLPKNPVTNYHFSQRELLIYVSEEVMKPHFGKNYFGKFAAEQVVMSGMHSIFADGGFYEEVDEISKVADQVLLVHLSREGCDWGKDSRNYVHIERDNIRTIELENNGTVPEAVEAINNAIVEEFR